MRPSRKGSVPQLMNLLLAVTLLVGFGPAARAEETAAGAEPAAPWVNATGAIVVDFETGEAYYEKDADVARPAASMSKVMSLYLVFEEIAAGNLSLDSYIPASQYAAGISNNPTYSGLERLRAGYLYQVDALIRLIVTESCNGSVIVLAEHIGGGDEGTFVQRMNDKAAQWGIDAHFADACGFEDEGNAVTPRAMAYIARRIIADYPEILKYTSLPSTIFQGKTFYSTNTLLRNGTCDGIDGLKTGTTDGAGYCFTGTAQRAGRRIISVVMNTTGYSARMAESKALLDYGFACRARREEQWARAIQSMEVDLAAQAPLWSRTETGLSARVTCPGEEIFATLRWEAEGAPLGEEETRWLKDGEEVTVPYTVPAGEDPVKAALILTLPDGTETRREAELPRPGEDMSFVGRLGVRQVEMYPETTLTVPFQVRLDQPVRGSVAAGWYLDGEPIPDYQNSAFQVGPDLRSSGYTLKGEQLAPGRHTLEFRCNTEGLPGVEQARFAAEVLVLDGESPAAVSDELPAEVPAA